MTTVWDCAVIGAGVVGLAVARECARSGRATLLVERHAHYGTETSSRNSEVIHSGIYYPAGSLKARACTAGRDRLYAYCRDRGVEHRQCGKLIVATDPTEVAALERLHGRAAENAVPGVEWLEASDVRRREPALRAVAALWVPTTGIVDSHGLMTALLGEYERAGGEYVPRTAVRRIDRAPQGFALLLEGADDPVDVRWVVNAAGLSAAALARCIEALDPAHVPRLRFAKGHYFDLRGAPPFRHLVYPVPVDGGLGVHATLDLAGRVRFGPDVEWLEAPEFTVDPARAGPFYAAIRRYWPGLPDDALAPAYAGVRPKLSGPGEAAADFRLDGPRVHGVPGLLCLYGIESPGLTAALALAELAVARLEGE